MSARGTGMRMRAVTKPTFMEPDKDYFIMVLKEVKEVEGPDAALEELGYLEETHKMDIPLSNWLIEHVILERR